ncbi:SbtR family transcriptional regulator, partial [Actinoallomurus acaciae]
RAVAEVRDRLRRLVERAQAGGGMRADLPWTDVPFLLAGVATGPRTIGLRAEDGQWNRNLRIVLDGLSTPRPAGTNAPTET